MADLKTIANIQIGGPKYPSKKRINLYQREFKKRVIAAQLSAFAVFLVFLYGFVQVGIVMPLQEAERAEQDSAHGAAAGCHEAGKQRHAGGAGGICPLWQCLAE